MLRISLLVSLLMCSVASAQSYVYTGKWITKNKPLDGEMTAVVLPTGKDAQGGFTYQVRFYGIWQGVNFDYTVNDLHGKPNNLVGSSMIDGAQYYWRAYINTEEFIANFGGDRYNGSFKLLKVK